ncbi:hypothetical protein GGR92_003325 [Spirosoma lacussanchae]|nr:hypothetical protein [Spirosoma lacussanchae]
MSRLRRWVDMSFVGYGHAAPPVLFESAVVRTQRDSCIINPVLAFIG